MLFEGFAEAVVRCCVDAGPGPGSTPSGGGRLRRGRGASAADDAAADLLEDGEEGGLAGEDAQGGSGQPSRKRLRKAALADSDEEGGEEGAGALLDSGDQPAGDVTMEDLFGED